MTNKAICTDNYNSTTPLHCLWPHHMHEFY
jgi:hypothetical protein